MKIIKKKKLLLIIFLSYFLFINFLHNDFKTEVLYHSQINSTKISYFYDASNELKEIQKYIDTCFNDTLIDNNKIFYPSNNPRISVIISVYNGEGYLKTSLLSVQNQDFKDIEILLIDDGSLDNSVKLIKEIMSKDPRIKLYQNIINRGILYTKIKGIINAKGKYILLLDEDDIYVQRDAFSTLYNEAEKNDLDLLNFGIMSSRQKTINLTYNRSKNEFPMIFQPELRKKMFNYNSKGEIFFVNGLLTNYFIKRNIFIKIINQIDEKYLKEKMNFHDDYVFFFLLTRTAYNLKKIDRIFYLVFRGWNETNKNIEFRIKEKYKNRDFNRCNSFLNFIDFILNKTENNYSDKKIAFFSFDKWFLSDFCRKYNQTLEKAINISNKFLENEYINDTSKEKIKSFLNEVYYN